MKNAIAEILAGYVLLEIHLNPSKPLRQMGRFVEITFDGACHFIASSVLCIHQDGYSPTIQSSNGAAAEMLCRKEDGLLFPAHLVPTQYVDEIRRARKPRKSCINIDAESAANIHVMKSLLENRNPSAYHNPRCAIKVESDELAPTGLIMAAQRTDGWFMDFLFGKRDVFYLSVNGRAIEDPQPFDGDCLTRMAC